jgi:cobalt-zinc-cadmium efflux system protein
MSGSKNDLNVRGAYLHMAADAAISLGVVVSGLVIMGTGWTWLDPAVSLVIVLVIVAGTWSLLREALRLMMAAVPASVDAAAVKQLLEQQAGVERVYDLHIWALSTTETALTAHLVMPAGYPGDSVIAAISTRLREEHAIAHCTLQVEEGRLQHRCALVME